MNKQLGKCYPITHLGPKLNVLLLTKKVKITKLQKNKLVPFINNKTRIKNLHRHIFQICVEVGLYNVFLLDTFQRFSSPEIICKYLQLLVKRYLLQNETCTRFLYTSLLFHLCCARVVSLCVAQAISFFNRRPTFIIFVIPDSQCVL